MHLAASGLQTSSGNPCSHRVSLLVRYVLGAQRRVNMMISQVVEFKTFSLEVQCTAESCTTFAAAALYSSRGCCRPGWRWIMLRYRRMPFMKKPQWADKLQHARSLTRLSKLDDACAFTCRVSSTGESMWRMYGNTGTHQETGLYLPTCCSIQRSA